VKDRSRFNVQKFKVRWESSRFNVQKNSNVKKHVLAGESATFRWTFEAASDTLNIELLNLERAAVYE
jgi:hypothetical protein